MKQPLWFLVLGYRVLVNPLLAAVESPVLSCPRDEVYAGERVVVHGKAAHEIVIPQAVNPGQRIWIEREGAWIDFTVVPLARTDISLDGKDLVIRLTSNLPKETEFTVAAHGEEQTLRLAPGQPTVARFDLGVPQHESAEVLTVRVRTGEASMQLERALRAVREILPLATLSAPASRGVCLRGGEERAELGSTAAIVEPRRTSSGNVARYGLFMHPPYRGGVGYAFARYAPIQLPTDSPAAFRAWVGKGDGSDPGDGILYRVVVEEPTGTNTVVARAMVTRHEWQPLEADLTRWAGQQVALKLVADVGPRDNSTGDWGCWADLRVESRQLRLHWDLSADVEPVRRAPGPHAIAGLTLDALRHARAGRLCYEGKGLSGTGSRFGSFAVLNGVELGSLAPASGDEARGVFSKEVSVPLNAQAIRSLDWRNRFALRNPNADCFSVRRFRLELVLADGRQCSSAISTATLTQPSGWAYAEGIGVPPDREIAVDIWFE